MRWRLAALAFLLAAILTVAALNPAPVAAATIAAKCHALTSELNRYRSPDVRLSSLLCSIAHSRSLAQARAGRGFHDIAYVVRRLNAAGIRWCLVGEAIAWTTARTGLAQRYVSLWRGSASHWSMLSASRYDRGGGSWRVGLDGDSRTYATYLVVDVC